MIQLHGCEAAHLQSQTVHEQMEGGVVWRGQVEIFKIVGQPQADRAYAWAWNDNGEVRYHIVLNIPPINSPRDAVQEALIRGVKR